MSIAKENELGSSVYGPYWDRYFLAIAEQVSKNTKCFSRQIGAVLVKDKAIISTGYNGPPRGIPPCSHRVVYKTKDNDFIPISQTENLCPRKHLGAKSGERLDICIAAHGEANAIVQAAMTGVSTKDSILYCNCGVPCKDCLVLIINAGVKSVVCYEGDYYDKMSDYLIKHSKLEIIKIDPEIIYKWIRKDGYKTET